MKPSEVQRWFVAVDARQAKLFSIEPINSGVVERWHVDLRSTLDNTWLAVHEHHRPSALGRGPMANAAQRFASLGHEEEELHRRFARDIGGWIRQRINDHRIDALRVFAPPELMNLVRCETKGVGGSIALVECELATFSPGELALHPAVLSGLR